MENDADSINFDFSFVETAIVVLCVSFGAMEQLSKAKAKWIRSLKDRKTRDSERVFVVEGKKMVQEALGAGWEIQMIACTRTELIPPNAPGATFLTTATEMASMSTLDQPEGVLAVLSYPDSDCVCRSAKLTVAPSGRAFWLDGIQDPGNLGTIIRIADWFGFTAVVCGPGTADCFNAKALRASMGSIFRVKIMYVDDLEAAVRSFSSQILLADMAGEDASQAAYAEKPFLLLGNEAKGVSPTIKSIPGLSSITIGRLGNAESLNVAVSAGILAAWATQPPR